MVHYANTPENASKLGWPHLPEYCVGDTSLPWVRHDARNGIFTFVQSIPAVRPNNKHMVRYAGAHYGARGEPSCYAVQYGVLQDVYADRAPNYCYREFWF